MRRNAEVEYVKKKMFEWRVEKMTVASCDG